MSGLRIAIVGAGVIGLLTAIRCAIAGHRVTVLDQGPIPNPAATSADQHRALRALHPGDPTTTRWASAAHSRWLDLERLLGVRFYRRVGAVTAVRLGDLDDVLEVAAQAGLAVTVIGQNSLPQLRFPPESVGVLEQDAGVLLADKVLTAAVQWLDRHPAVTLRPWHRVRAAANLPADRVIVAAGPWSGDLVDTPMMLHRQTMIYLLPPADLLPRWQTAPTACGIGLDGDAWLLPPSDGVLLKVSSSAACREVTEIGTDPGWAEKITLASILPDADRYILVSVKDCHYLTAPVTLNTVAPNVVAHTSQGGDFKTAPLIAERLTATIGAAA